SWYGFDVAFRSVRVAYLTAEHLKSPANSYKRLPPGHVEPDIFFPIVRSEPKQIRDGVLASRQDQHVGLARLFRSPRVIDNQSRLAFQRGEVREIRKVREPYYTHAQSVFTVERRLNSTAFERNAVFIINAVIVQVRDDSEALLRKPLFQITDARR